jgi:hypothetical protein
VVIGVRARSAQVAITALTIGLVTSCGASQDQSVTEAAESYAEALAQDNGASACSVLAPSTRSELEQSSGKDCTEAILDEAVTDMGARVSVAAYGTMAQVRFASDTVFLTRFRTGWRVLAAACTPPEGVGPYDCQVQGG